MKRAWCLFLIACTQSSEPSKSAEELFAHYRIEESPGGLAMPQEGIDNATLEKMLTDDRMPAITSLELSGNRIGIEGLRSLLNSPKTAQLSFLNLSHNRLEDDAIQLLADSPRIHQIEQLLIAGNKLSHKSAMSLTKAISPDSRLRILSLGQQAIGDAGAQALSRLQKVEILDLEQADVSASGASELMAHTQASSLILKNNPLHTGSFALQEISPHLEEVDLRSCSITPAAMKAFGQAQGSENWTRLQLDNNPLGNAGIAALGDARWLQDLKKLTVHESTADLEHRKQLRESWGKRGGLKVEPR